MNKVEPSDVESPESVNADPISNADPINNASSEESSPLGTNILNESLENPLAQNL